MLGFYCRADALRDDDTLFAAIDDTLTPAMI